MNTDAWLGFSRTAYQSASVKMNLCEAEKFALVRLVGTTPRARSIKKLDIAQRAEVGYGPCRGRATHVAAPPTLQHHGSMPPSKGRGLSLRKNFGPWCSSTSGSHSLRAIFWCSRHHAELGGGLPAYVLSGTAFTVDPVRNRFYCRLSVGLSNPEPLLLSIPSTPSAKPPPPLPTVGKENWDCEFTWRRPVHSFC